MKYGPIFNKQFYLTRKVILYIMISQSHFSFLTLNHFDCIIIFLVLKEVSSLNGITLNARSSTLLETYYSFQNIYLHKSCAEIRIQQGAIITVKVKNLL